MKSIILTLTILSSLSSFAYNNCSNKDFCERLNAYPGICNRVTECAKVQVQGRCAYLGYDGQDWCKFQNNERSCNLVASIQNCEWISGGLSCRERRR